MFNKIIIIIIFLLIFLIKLSANTTYSADKTSFGTGYETGKLSKFQKGSKLIKRGIKLEKKNKIEKAKKKI